MAASSQPKNTMIWSGIFCKTTTLKNEMEAKEDGTINESKSKSSSAK